MLDSSLERILTRLSGDHRVLDVGGWAQPLPRADWVIDLMPYETRGLYGRLAARVGRELPPPSEADERFSAETWVERDVCDREPWPFADGQFDFVVCAQTLEDVRDPVWVCHEMARVGRAGYVEVPARIAEQAWWMQGPWAGWGHHHWLIDRAGDGLEFVFKPHVLHGNRRAQLAARLVKRLPPEERNLTLWWEGALPARERVFLDGAEMDDHLERLVRDRRDLARPGVRVPSPRDLGAMFRRRGSGGS